MPYSKANLAEVPTPSDVAPLLYVPAKVDEAPLGVTFLRTLESATYKFPS